MSWTGSGFIMTRWSGHNLGIILNMSLAPKMRHKSAQGKSVLFSVHAIVNALLVTVSRGQTAQFANGSVTLSA